MDFSLQHSVSVLRRTPSVLTALLSGLDDAWTRANYGPDTFSPFDVVGHLIQADRHNWMARLRQILATGDSTPFPMFDRYAMFEADKGKSTDDVLNEFTEVRAANLLELDALALTPAQLELRGMHPALGTATVRQLLASWTVHDLGHLHQIAKAMAYQYRSEVGPWREYLTILPRPKD